MEGREKWKGNGPWIIVVCGIVAASGWHLWLTQKFKFGLWLAFGAAGWLVWEVFRAERRKRRLVLLTEGKIASAVGSVISKERGKQRVREKVRGNQLSEAEKRRRINVFLRRWPT